MDFGRDGEYRVGINVETEKFDIGAFFGELFENRGQHFTGTAPGGVVIDESQFAGFYSGHVVVFDFFYHESFLLGITVKTIDRFLSKMYTIFLKLSRGWTDGTVADPALVRGCERIGKIEIQQLNLHLEYRILKKMYFQKKVGKQRISQERRHRK